MLNMQSINIEHVNKNKFRAERVTPQVKKVYKKNTPTNDSAAWYIECLKFEATKGNLELSIPELTGVTGYSRQFIFRLNTLEESRGTIIKDKRTGKSGRLETFIRLS